MSVNIRTILDAPSLTSRAAATIASLVLVVISASAALIPGQPVQLLGLEILVLFALTMVLVVVSAIEMYRYAGRRYRAPTITKISVTVIQVLPLGIGGLLLLSAEEQGLYWIAAGALLVIIGSVANAWVLLVEILR